MYVSRETRVPGVVGIPTGNLPLSAVLRPQTNTILLLGNTNALVQLDNSGTQVLPALSNLAIRDPGVLVLPRLAGRIPGPPTQALVVRDGLSRRLEQVVKRAMRRVVRLQQRAVHEAPVTVYGSAVRSLGARDGEGIWGAWRRRLRNSRNVRLGFASGRTHCRDVIAMRCDVKVEE